MEHFVANGNVHSALQATSNDLPANLHANLFMRPVWIGPKIWQIPFCSPFRSGRGWNSFHSADAEVPQTIARASPPGHSLYRHCRANHGQGATEKTLVRGKKYVYSLSMLSTEALNSDRNKSIWLCKIKGGCNHSKRVVGCSKHWNQLQQGRDKSLAGGGFEQNW